MNTTKDFEKYYNYSLRFLSYRPRSEKEIKEKLKSKKAESQVIETIVQKLKEQKFLNDEEFTRWWIEQRTKFKPKSLRLIKLELRQKGITNDIIEDQILILHLADKDQLLSEKERAKKLIENKMERLKGLTKQEVYQKIGPFLARRGFDFDTMHEVIDEYYKKGV